MTIDSFIRRLDRTFTWLYYKHQWAEWELIVIAIIALFLLLWILKRQGRAAKSTNANQGSQRSPIIGIKLADHYQSKQAIENAREHHSDIVAGFKGRKKQKTVAARIETLNEQLRQMQSKIDKYRTMEERFIEKVTELTDANEKLRNEVTKYTQDEQQSGQQINEPAFAGDQQSREPMEHTLEHTSDLSTADIEHEKTSQPDRPTEVLKHKITDSPQAGKQLEHTTAQRQKETYAEFMITQEHQDDDAQEETAEQTRTLRRDNEPLDVEKLKSIAALARQIQGYPRHG